MGDWMQEKKSKKAYKLKEKKRSERMGNADSKAEKEIQNTLAAATPVTQTSFLDTPDMSVVADHKHPAPPLPLEHFGFWKGWIADASASKCAPHDFVAISLLCATASLISNVRRAYVMGDWKEPPILWGALVGNPSSGKSPALDLIRDAIRNIENELAKDYKKLLEEYESKKMIAELNFEKWQAACAKAIKDGDTPPAKPEAAVIPECPPRPRLCISDITIEKAAVVAMDNLKGLLLCRDELSGLLANFTRHGGSDREFYLEAYGGRCHTVDRKKDPEPYIIPHLAISILGTIQPEKLGRLLTETEDDGFAARFLFAWPDPIPYTEPTRMDEPFAVQNAFEKLRTLTADTEDNEPILVKFDKEAQASVSQWRAKLQSLEEAEQGVMVSFLGKMPGVVIRLAMTLVYLDWAKSDKKQEPKVVSDVYVRRAVALVDNYFIPMGKRALGEYAVPQRQVDGRIIAKIIMAKKCETVNIRDMKRSCVLPTRDAERYDAAIRFLISCGWLHDAKQRDGDVGRRQKTYIV